MAHYFTDNSNLESKIFLYETTIFGEKYGFYSDNGVFSKDKLDFGSRLLIEEFINPDVNGLMLDLGCGIGVIGIALAKHYKRELVMSDVNPRAVSLAEKNALKNEISFKAFCADSFTDNNETYAVVVSNPPIRAGKKVIYNFFQGAYDHLLPNGELWIVMRRNQGAESAINKLNEIFNNAEAVEKKNGFWIIKSKKIG